MTPAGIKARVLPFCFLLALAFLGRSCTVNYSFSGADIPAGANTFSIQTFQVITPLADATYGLTLTESLKDLMLSQTRLSLAQNNGDLSFSGSVIGYNVSTSAVSADESASMNRFTITIKVNYINRLDKSKNFEKTFSRYADYPASQDFTAVEAQLVADINRQLTQDIFDNSLGAW